MTNAELNKIIVKVMSTQFKKDAKEAHTAVEAAGYQIEKYNGSFMIINPETGRTVYIQYPKCGYGRAKIFGDYRWKKSMEWKDEKFDFVGFLNKPINEAWHKAQWSTVFNPVMEKYSKLKSARWNVQYHESEIEKIEKEMKKLQERLMYHAVQKDKDLQNLANVKRELGIKH